MSSLETQLGFFFSHLEDSMTLNVVQETTVLPSCAMQLMKAVCLPRPAGFITFLAAGESANSNSLNNQIASLCGTP